MNISFNTASTSILPPPVSDTQGTQQTSQTSTNLTVSTTSGTQNVGGTSSTVATTLSYPLIGPEDVPLNELMQQLQNLDMNSIKSMLTTTAVLMTNKDLGDMAAVITRGGTSFIKENKEPLTTFFGNVETEMKKAETQLFDLINSSTYPEFTEFLGKMLIAAQELREIAAQAKHSMVLGEYNNVLDQAKQMEFAAKKNFESTMKEIEASRTEAIGKIIAGVVTIGVSVGGARFGAKNPGLDALGNPATKAQGMMMGMQAFAPIGTGLGGVIDGTSGLIASGDKQDAANLKMAADMANAIQKKLEAAQKLLQEAEGISEELMNIAKTLADMVLKLYQDFMSNQNQIVQRSNI